MPHYESPPHFGLSVLAQDTWTVKIASKVSTRIKTKFESIYRDPWEEDNRDALVLFNPKSPDYDPTWGSWDIQVCEICPILYETLETFRGIQQGFTLISHKNLTSDELHEFLGWMLSDNPVKKIRFVHLNSIKSVSKITEKAILERFEPIKVLKISETEFFPLLLENKISPLIIYEILKSRT